MKLLVLSFILLLLSHQAEAIGKKKSKEDPKDVKIDSLTKASKILTTQLDSVSRELVVYTGVYAALKEKVFLYNFDPAKTSVLIDSLRASRDSLAVLPENLAKSKASSDSILMILNENKVLKNRCDSIKVAWEKYMSVNTAEDVEKAKAVSGIKQLKELLDNKVISEAEYASLKKKYLEKL